MFEVLLYVVVAILVLAFVGDRPDEIGCEIPPVDQLDIPFNAELDESEVFESGEWATAIASAKLHDLNTLSASEIRELCKQHGIQVGQRGRIRQSVIDELAAVMSLPIDPQIIAERELVDELIAAIEK